MPLTQATCALVNLAATRALKLAHKSWRAPTRPRYLLPITLINGPAWLSRLVVMGAVS